MSALFRVLALDGISAKGLEVFEADDRFEVEASKALSEEDLIARLPGVSALIVRSATKVTRKAIESADSLKVIGRAGVGVDNVDVEAATERGIVVMNTPGGNTISTAEHTFSLMLALARNIAPADASMRAGAWDRKKFEGTELCNKTLGIIGMGRIGGEVARRAIGFGMRVIAFDPYLALSRAKSLQVELIDDLKDLLPQADFLTLHMPLTPETKGILNTENLALCKKGVRLVNCARGGLISEADIVTGIESGQLGGAALDVYEKEPLAADSPLRGLPNVVLTPHLAASTSEAQEGVGIEIAESLTAYLATGSVRNAVNMPNVDARTLAVLRPYLSLGEKLGRVMSQLAPPRVDQIIVRYSGKVADVDTAPVTRAVLKGLLMQSTGGAVNEVNAPKYAKRHGIAYRETKLSEPGEYSELIQVEAQCGEERYEVSATFLGHQARIVGVNGFQVEVAPEGVLFLMENRDRPGIVGWIGTFLGKRNINIANMTLSRAEPGALAFCILGLDSKPEPALIEEILEDKDITSVKLVDLS